MITVANIKSQDGKVFLTADCNPVAIDIMYEGKVFAESNLPDGYFMTERAGRIIIARLGQNEVTGHLFSYVGDFKILSAKIYSESGSSVSAVVDTETHLFMDTDSNWENCSSNWEDFSGDEISLGDNERHFKRTLEIKRSVFVMKSMYTPDIGRLYYEDGSEYIGEVNYNNTTGFSTGSVKTKDSIPLKRKLRKIIKKGGRR